MPARGASSAHWRRPCLLKLLVSRGAVSAEGDVLAQLALSDDQVSKLVADLGVSIATLNELESMKVIKSPEAAL